MLAKLEHPHIVRFHESFMDERQEHLCIVQDYCGGGTLQVNSMRQRPHPWYWSALADTTLLFCSLVKDRIQMALKATQPFTESAVMEWSVFASASVSSSGPGTGVGNACSPARALHSTRDALPPAWGLGSSK